MTQQSPFAKRTALVLVDLQNDFCHPEGTAGKRGKHIAAFQDTFQSIAHLLESARRVASRLSMRFPSIVPGVNPHPKRNDSAVKNKALPSLIVNRKHGGRASIIHFSRSLTKKSLSNIDIVLFCIPIWSLYYGPVTLNIWFWPGFTPMFASTVQHGTDPCGIFM